MSEPFPCQRCGTPLPMHASFCRRCGLAIARSRSPIQPPIATPRAKPSRGGAGWAMGLGLFMFMGFFGFFHVSRVPSPIPAKLSPAVDDNYYQPARDSRAPDSTERRRINRDENQRYYYRQN